MRFFTDLLNLFFPQVCCTCDKPLVKNEFLICFSCRGKLPKTNYEQADDNELKDRFYGKINIEYAFAYLNFHKSGITQRLLFEFKYRNQPEIGDLVGNWFGAELAEHKLLTNIDYIIPVPLHPKKEYKRGYNQSQHFASGISEVSDIPTNFSALRRITYGKSQTKQSREHRWKSVKKAFQVKRIDEIKSKHILLVDDVVTTGATLEACGKQLLQAGASKISVATLAIAK